MAPKPILLCSFTRRQSSFHIGSVILKPLFYIQTISLCSHVTLTKTMPSSQVVVFGLVTLLVAMMVPSIYALHCWQCNTEVSKHCDDLPAGPVQNVSRLDTCIQEFYKECISRDERIKYTFCRKQVQTIDGKERTIRSCGFERSPSECYQTRNPPIQTTVCQCDGDGCNSAPMGSMATTMLTVGSILIAFFGQRFLC